MAEKPQNVPAQTGATAPTKHTLPAEFPAKIDKDRIADYDYYFKLFEGKHFDAFKVRVGSKDFNEAYARIRYLYVNFAGMISRIVADMLFGEQVKIKVDDEKAQAWLEDFWRENFLDALWYESALTNSAVGDALVKLRTAQIDDNDPSKGLTVKLEQAPASIYYPHINPQNVNSDPTVRELAWIVPMGKDQYLYREIYELGKITYEAWEMHGDKPEVKVPVSTIFPGAIDELQTKIDRHILLHIPNWRTGMRWNGYSDYYDLDALFFAINNRLSMTDNVLDKHTDPILMVPPGVIDPKTGKVKRKDGRVIEMESGEDGKPEYIVWDASLENAFKQIEKMVQMMWMVSEISPDTLGLGDGQADSGRALKFKLMRTIAKVNRKKVYYDHAIKEALYVAQLLAKANGAKVNGKAVDFEPVMPELVWADGIPADDTEMIDNITKEIDAGILDRKSAAQKMYGIDEKSAQKRIDEVDKEKEAAMPVPLDPTRNPFAKTMPPKAPGGEPNKKPDKGAAK